MGKDPLFRQSDDETERLVADKTVMRFAGVIVLLKAVTGVIALALIAAIFMVWRAQ